MSEELYRSLGERVATLRTNVGLTQEALGSRIGMRRASVASIEAGRQSVTLDQLYQLASALELESLSELISLDVPRYQPLAGRLREPVTPGQLAQIDLILRNALASSGGRKS
jgi:transcriptional regulator with XRE-family HTH domain